MTLAISSFQVNAQLINCNPDPNGNPWWAGGIPEATPEIQAYLDAIPQLTLINGSQNAPLNDVVDNSQHAWFRPIFLQDGGSCAQAAGVGYLFTYEINRVRDPQQNETSNPDNQYPTHFTWNFLNNGDGSYSFYQHGWDIIKESGVPTVAQYGGLWKPYNDAQQRERVWETAYINYNQALQNKVINAYYSIDVKTPDGLNNLKHWLSDHGANESTGGLANFSCYMYTGSIYVQLPPQSDEAGKWMIKKWGATGKHAMTIVGYNDNIKYDFNGDGQFTNSGNNMSDWEIGALKVANSWDVNYYNSGFIYMPYRLLAQIPGSIENNIVYVVNVVPTYTPELNLKTTVSHTCRNKLSYIVGYADNANKTTPDESTSSTAFKYHGGCYDMQGVNNDPIETGLDFNNFFGNREVGKIFFKITENDTYNVANGVIHEFSLIDYRWGEEFELPCNYINVPIINNGTTTLSINYHLLPHHEEHITNEYRVTDDRVSRFTTEVEAGGTLKFMEGSQYDDLNVDMYNSIIHIKEGGSLVFGNYNTITAKRGICRIIIDGSIDVPDGVVFKADEGASLEVILNNNNSSYTLNSIGLYNASIKSYAQNLSITGINATDNSAIYSYRGNVTIQNGSFLESKIRLENFSAGDFKATIKSLTFDGNSSSSIRGVFLYNYGKYEIVNNTIANCNLGIQLMRCGSGAAGNQLVKDNYIYNNTLAGILAYNTTGKYTGTNYIYNNGYGVQFYNTCNVTLNGNPCASVTNLTQNIVDNQSYEIFATQYGFPPYCKYNLIRDDDNGGNPSDPIVYYDNNYQIPQIVNVSRNCWGSGFNAQQDLKINNGTINYTPTSCPPYNCDPIWNTAEQLYLEAESLAENGECVAAVSLFQDIIDNYPNSGYTMASMKSLSRLAGCASLGYDSLYNYFITADSIINDSTLKYLGEYLANECNISLQKYPEAIEWYENQILDPQSPEDSLFAIIDLGNLYLSMQNNGLKQSINGKLTQFKPVSEEQYFNDADYYLSLLPFKKDENKNQDPKLSELCKLEQNTPNPFTSTTTIKYSLSQSAIIKIVITDMTGRVLIDKNEGSRDKGNYTVTLNNLKLEAGNYLYSIYLNDKLFDTKKMTIIK